ncbi:hypothetical protein NDU88_006851 [Pleurodeles waltl]|uniref:Uncharacterized protein n=1 Tax=Pleurodeles waltl TaxID=8319 RepID=A0AAV7N0F1_PLEWA|nr:hypothetical protein NDU88_006851 [Pleurodeles waltl]
MRHSVNQALVQAIQPIKHHLLGLVDQQAWPAPAGALPMGEPSFSADTQSAKQIPNPHAADFQSLLRNMAREHDYNAGSLKKAVDAHASSSASSGHSSEQEDAPPLTVPAGTVCARSSARAQEKHPGLLRPQQDVCETRPLLSPATGERESCARRGAATPMPDISPKYYCAQALLIPRSQCPNLLTYTNTCTFVTSFALVLVDDPYQKRFTC